MSGPAYSNGDGTHGGGGEGEGLPRVPQQRDQPGIPRAVPDPPPGPAELSEPSEPNGTAEPVHPAGPSAPAGRRPGGTFEEPAERLPLYDHATLKALLGAWALTACSRDESLAVEVHLTDCATCAEEALRLRDAVGLLHREESLDLDPLLRARVLEGCLGRRPARIPVPEWAGPYDAEAARLDALLRDLGDTYWQEPVELRWYDNGPVTRKATVGEVIAHLTAVDGLVAAALDVPGAAASDGLDLPADPTRRTEALWAARRAAAAGGAGAGTGAGPAAGLRDVWRAQSHTLLRTVSFAGAGAAGVGVDYGLRTLPLRTAFVDRAFACWIHAWDIAEAVAYPYDPPAPRNLNRIIDLAANLLPGAMAGRRRQGLASFPARLADAGAPGRSLVLRIEGAGGGDWCLPVDSPGTTASPEHAVAEVAMDGVEFCQLAAGHLEPERIAVGQQGDRAVIRDALFAAASLSRL
ncbi:MDMPI N domain containing protein [Actinacidiphila epipremni]|uniref:MDMPI N domain containing protein n=1 Tax=Actinacidiphila epipremni TaxID=2053013 RepID=A0ABX0ZSQ1_9ACTN|nr:MDMPI N domain containing protein [Actinacidiphila epipremni]NJP46945.1 MDMPI N domain containing protein [Actinacidiphila epipremni]